MKLVRIVVNWTAILLMPLWVLPFVIFLIVQDFIDGNQDEILCGEIWFWEF